MAEMGWTSRVAAAAGAAAGTGAAQLGLGYGLGVVVWPVSATADDSEWLGSLGWATWIAASATVFGAVIAGRLGGGPARRWSPAWRLILASSAAVGALVAVALIALPARSAVRGDTFSPQVIAGGYALLGVALGLIVAFWAVVSRPIAANLMATGALLWALAIAAIMTELAWHRDSATYLTSWQFAQSSGDARVGTIFWPSALLTLTAAFLVGAIAAGPAIRRGNLGLGTAVSGVVGPLLVGVAFLALAPRLTGNAGPLESAYLVAPYAVLAGLAGSALAVTAGRAAADRGTSDRKPDRDVAAIPAASPAARGAAKGPFARLTGRAKLPAQPSPSSAGPAAPDLPTRDESPAERRSPAPDTASALSEPAAADPEIAAAARPNRERARKATTVSRQPKSTVTPPPSEPAIARINPPASDD